MDQAYAKDMTVTITLSLVFRFATSDATNCALATIKVFNNAHAGPIEVYSGDYNTG